MNSIRKTRELLLGKKLSCAELTEAYLAAAHRENGALSAYTLITDGEARRAAAAVDARIAKGELLPPLAGIPFVLKDNISTAGIPTTCASRMLADYVPIYDATVWRVLKEQGAVMTGKGNMDEFAMGSTCETSYFGGAKNPHDLTRVAGGSSGGVACAVAGGTAVYGVGSDTGGSIRQPASFCGLVGLKPTYGAVSRNGLIAYASSFDQIGPITSCVEDAATVFDALCGKDPADMTCRGAEPVSSRLSADVRGLRIGVAREFFENLPADIASALERAMDFYKAAGAELREIEFPMLRWCLPVYYILACAEASSNLGRYDGLRYGHRAERFEDLDDLICRTRSEGFGPEVRRRIILGTYVLSSGYYDAYYNKAQALRRTIRNRFREVFASCDVLLTPTVPVTALRSGAGLSPVETYQTDICTVSVNIAGLPAVSVPCGFDGEGLPIGMQLIGDRFTEARLLSAALAFESGTGGEYVKDCGRGAAL